jgi:hypothetical protein
MYGVVQDNQTEAQFEPLVFGGAVTSQDEVIDLADEYPQSATIVYARLEYSGMREDSRWMTRWVLDGREYFSRVYDEWIYGEEGTAWISLFNYGGLNSGTYDLDLFVDGALVSTGQLRVLPGDLPPMTYSAGFNVGATISYPLGWNVIDLFDNEVAVLAARDPASQDFFGVTGWETVTGREEDIFQRFEIYFEALRAGFEDVTVDEREEFALAGEDGWLNMYTYTDAAGLPIQGAVAGVIDPDEDLVFIVAVESHADQWDAKLAVFNIMLERLLID